MSIDVQQVAPLAIASAFRVCGRRVLREPQDIDRHRERLGVALQMPGIEATQGVLADFFWGVTGSASEKQDALLMASDKLNPYVLACFGGYVGEHTFPSCSKLATRWSILVATSLDIPRRAMRCNADASRLLAQQVLRAWARDDQAAQLEFLTHCTVCNDTLAFMLARRSIIRSLGELPPEWAVVGQRLEQARFAS